MISMTDHNLPLRSVRYGSLAYKHPSLIADGGNGVAFKISEF